MEQESKELKESKIKLIACKVLENKEICKNYFCIKIDWLNADKTFLQGQFVELEVSSSLDPVLRRPFSIFDCDETSFSIAYKKIGKGTDLLSQKKAGDFISVIGPLGNSYPIDLITGYKNILIIGGGTGVASVHYLAKILDKKNINYGMLIGFKSQHDIYCLDEIKSLKTTGKIIITTDEGSFGHKGFVPDYFDEFDVNNTLIFMCGPEIIIRKWHAKMKEHKIKDFKFYASFEEYMACGIGICNGCVIKIKNEAGYKYKRVCKDGTIFDVEEVIWD
jgi:dihydroorotate dehydrogenase electron transfer subunit